MSWTGWLAGFDPEAARAFRQNRSDKSTEQPYRLSVTQTRHKQTKNSSVVSFQRHCNFILKTKINSNFKMFAFVCLSRTRTARMIYAQKSIFTFTHTLDSIIFWSFKTIFKLEIWKNALILHFKRCARTFLSSMLIKHPCKITNGTRGYPPRPRMTSIVAELNASQGRLFAKIRQHVNEQGP